MLHEEENHDEHRLSFEKSGMKPVSDCLPRGVLSLATKVYISNACYCKEVHFMIELVLVMSE